VIHCAVVAVLGAAGLAPATEAVLVVAVWEVPVLGAGVDAVFGVVAEAAVLDAPVEVFWLDVVLEAPAFAAVVEVLFPAEVLDVPALAVVAEVL